MLFLTVYGRLPEKAIVVSSPLSVRAGQAGESNDFSLAAGRGKSGYLKDVPRVFQHMLVCCDQYAELHGFRKLLGRLYGLFTDTVVSK